ncbi:MAG: phosphoadenosine phosphosulfate reductase family protein [Planctomycetaceae bacterium]
MTEMISFGAGVNSVAMTIMLIEQGWRGPVVFADTGGEHPDTYCYLEYFERDYLKPRGMEITRLAPGSEWHEPRQNCSLYQFCFDRGIIPLAMTKWCSVEWKQEPQRRWLEAHGITTRLIGFALDESNRVKDYPGLSYPLIDAGITRAECGRIIQRAGLLAPKKSGCFYCPSQSVAAWRALHYEYPDLYEQAIALEENATARAGQVVTLDAHGISLRQHLERRWQGQMEMDLSDWLPCACRL